MNGFGNPWANPFASSYFGGFGNPVMASPLAAATGYPFGMGAYNPWLGNGFQATMNPFAPLAANALMNNALLNQANPFMAPGAMGAAGGGAVVGVGGAQPFNGFRPPN
jgi:hypothetical protein